MSLIAQFIAKIKRPKPPVIDTPWGPVTEAARLRAALNMREDPELRDKVTATLQDMLSGDREAAVEEMKRRYPEAFE
jgi:hypothetical protein